MRIVEELHDRGHACRDRCRTPEGLAAAGIADADAVVCVDDDDALNLEIALLARQANPDVRVVARLANTVLREAMAQDNGPGAILDVADLAAPSVVEACLARSTHTISVAGIDFVISGTDAPRDATLREMYGDLAPVAVIYGENSDTPGDVVVCPGRDFRVRQGDWTAMIGTADELAAQGIAVPKPLPHTRARRSPLQRVVDAARTLRDDINPDVLPRAGRVAHTAPRLDGAAAVHLPNAAGDELDRRAVLLHRDHRHGRLRRLQLHRPADLAADVGHRADVRRCRPPPRSSLRSSPTCCCRAGSRNRPDADRSGTCATTSSSSASARSASASRATSRRPGTTSWPSSATRTTATWRRQRELGVPVIFGDATLRQTLESARIEEARAIAVLTQDDMVNIETGIVLHEMLAPRAMPGVNRPDVPTVLRVYDRALGAAVAHRFGFDNVRSTVELAAPWFIGAAMGLQVFGTFSVGQRSFMVGGVYVEPGSDLDGMRMADMPTQTRVIAITRPGTAARIHPRRDAKLSAGDTAYLVGPYRELLDALRKGQGAQPSDVNDPATTG